MGSLKINTPWGFADEVVTIAPGICKAYTPSHGGILLDQAHVARIPRAIDAGYSGRRSAWEEDADWAVPFLLFEREVAAWYVQNYRRPIEELREIARKTLKDYRPDWLAAIDKKLEEKAHA